MFENIGGKIKDLAVLVCWIGIIASIIAAVVLCSAGSIGFGLAVLIAGGLSSWIGSFAAYALGEITENSEKQTAMIKQLCDEQKTMNDNFLKFCQTKTADVVVGEQAKSSKHEIMQKVVKSDEREKEKSVAKANSGSEEKVAYVNRSVRDTVCPFCNTVQRSDRYLCFKCGAAFVDEETMQNR